MAKGVTRVGNDEDLLFRRGGEQEALLVLEENGMF